MYVCVAATPEGWSELPMQHLLELLIILGKKGDKKLSSFCVNKKSIRYKP
jgi:hypothetical protein